ncbi:MAG TPA: PAS domain S-box protein [Blastocatellia bacterium]|nr:PAS domain S-box protein [Blastocatellia bacterium]
MDLETFSKRIKAARLRSAELDTRVRQLPPFNQEVLQEAIEELEITLEELRVAEEELRQQNEQIGGLCKAFELEHQQYQELFEFAPDAYMVTDENGIIKEANLAAAELFDTSKQSLRGKPLVVFIDRQEHGNFFSELHRLKHLHSERRLSLDIRFQPRNKQPFHAAVTVGLSRRGYGGRAGLRWLIRDITERKRAEEEIRSLNAKLERQVAERAQGPETARHEYVRTAASHKPAPRLPVENDLLAALPPEEYERILPSLELVPLIQGDILYRPEDKIDHVYFPLSGLVSLVSVTEQGATIEVGMVGSNGMVGISLFLGGGLTPYLVIVQVPGTALRMGRAAFEIESGCQGSLHAALLRHTHILLSMLTQSAVCNRFHTLDEKLCRWLLTTQDFVKDNEFALTQEFISQMLGVRRAGITVAARELQDQGLIQYSRGKIIILSREGLESKTCECYRIVRSEIDRLLSK